MELQSVLSMCRLSFSPPIGYNFKMTEGMLALLFRKALQSKQPPQRHEFPVWHTSVRVWLWWFANPPPPLRFCERLTSSRAVFVELSCHRKESLQNHPLHEWQILGCPLKHSCRRKNASQCQAGTKLCFQLSLSGKGTFWRTAFLHSAPCSKSRPFSNADHAAGLSRL